MTTTSNRSRYEGASNADVEHLRDEVEGMIAAGASNREIRQTMGLSEDGLLNIIRAHLEELRARRRID